MSDSSAPSAAPVEEPKPEAVAPAAAPAAPVAAPVRGRNIIGIIAFAFALAGFLFAVIPPTSFIAWLLALPAIVLGIIGLTRKNQGKKLALTGLLVGILAWIVAIIVATASAFLAVGAVIDEANNAPSVGSEVEPEDSGEAPVEAVIGDTVVNEDGVGFTVTAIACGMATAGDGFLTADAAGQFCEVKVALENGSNESVNLSSFDITGYIGDAEYEVDATVSTFGGEIISVDVNPGLSTEAVVYIDIPADAALEYVQYKGVLSFIDPVVVKVS